MSGVLATGAEGRRRAAGVTPYTALRGLNPSEGESDCLEFKLAGPKAGKVSVPPFQRGAGSRGRAPVARRNGRNTFPKGAFYFGSTFLFARKKERWKPCAPCRGRHPGRGAAGLLVTNGGQPFGAEKPDGPVPGGRTGYPSKTPQWGVLEIAKNCTVHPFPPRGSVTAGAPRPLQTIDQHPQAGGDGDEGKGGELLFSQILHREPKGRQQGGDKKGL